MRPPILRAGFEYGLWPGEITVDNFAGGGGASTGIEAAIAQPIDIAINHSPEAIAMHKANHPETKHFCENIWQVDPVVACEGRPVGFVWFSPDCTHHSRAKGTKPLSKKIRGLAWVVIRWAEAVRPRVIFLENVEEFAEWGPLDRKRRPIKERRGETFRKWRRQLQALGYVIEHRSLVAADYGTPTTRKRLFLVARCDGGPITWPEETHGKGRPKAWRPAADIIDWSLAPTSIFDRKKPLAEATLRRIAAGIRKYVVDCADPFIVPLTHQGGDRVHSVREPVRTITAAHRGELALATPYVVRHGHYSKRTGAGLVEGAGAGLFRGQPLRIPLATVCATNDKQLITPELKRVDAAFLTKFYGTAGAGAPVTDPLPTVTAGGGRGGGHLAEVRAMLIKYYGAGGQTQDIRDPLHTVTSKARFGLVTVHGEQYQIVDIGMRMLQPHELFAAQGFPKSYKIAPTFNGKPLTKTAQTALAGNSVCPDVAEALVAVNIRGPRTRQEVA